MLLQTYYVKVTVLGSYTWHKWRAVFLSRSLHMFCSGLCLTSTWKIQVPSYRPSEEAERVTPNQCSPLSPDSPTDWSSRSWQSLKANGVCPLRYRSPPQRRLADFPRCQTRRQAFRNVIITTEANYYPTLPPYQSLHSVQRVTPTLRCPGQNDPNNNNSFPIPAGLIVIVRTLQCFCFKGTKQSILFRLLLNFYKLLFMLQLRLLSAFSATEDTVIVWPRSPMSVRCFTYWPLWQQLPAPARFHHSFAPPRRAAQRQTTGTLTNGSGYYEDRNSPKEQSFIFSPEFSKFLYFLQFFFALFPCYMEKIDQFCAIVFAIWKLSPDLLLHTI